MDFKQKYLKYKEKYLALNSQVDSISSKYSNRKLMKGGARVGDFIVNKDDVYIGLLKELVGDRWSLHGGEPQVLTAEENITWFVYTPPAHAAAAHAAAAPAAAAAPGGAAASSEDLVHFSADIHSGDITVLSTLLAGLDSMGTPTKHLIFNLMDTKEVFRFRELSKLAKASVDEGSKHIKLDLPFNLGNYRPHVALTWFASIFRDLQNIEEVNITTRTARFYYATYLLESLPHIEKVKRLILHNQADPELIVDIVRLLPRMPNLELLDIRRFVYFGARARHEEEYEMDDHYVAQWAAIRAALPARCVLSTELIRIPF